ncbi:membrane fusion protein (multidrug efflux system) [Catalinimonas alkaloidigena]|uniref:efflux RND transporter periplasmic adaptor subunit n=1 Tax=Catalinimonas alkaloidigena TaxID=1075417 RepID=UPI002406BECD|nr:efflux RND transporter periplasmic adaptor subunit [Catalinimonas alkaloidigena]MDF9797601.1 membrane fusion protein (multidrug efflux system) [Catalinimonas alkaloidigena]
MNKVRALIITVLILSVYGCSNETGDLEAKKQQIQDYKSQIQALESKVKSLEEDIASNDPTFVSSTDRNATLVTTIPIRETTFKHYVEVRGEVTSRRNVTVSAQVPAMVVKVPATEGKSVRKGEVLITQDAETIRTNIDEIKTSLELAETRFDRQANLWEQNIGTEFQYLEAKNAKESLERKLASLNAQLSNYIILAPFSGTVDEVFVKEGEMAQPGVPMLRLVSLSNMFIKANISEAYLGQFEKGDSVEVHFPTLDKTTYTTISSVGQVINQNNRTYSIEVKIPGDESSLRPNMLAELRLKDFEQQNANIIPTNLIQNDNQGDFVYVASSVENGEGLVAQKKHITIGKTYQNQTMVESGLSGDERLIDQGFRNVAEGVMVRTDGGSSIQSLNASSPSTE